MVDQETNLHPKNNPSINLKPNIVTGNIPDKAVTFKQLDEDLQNRIELNEANIDIITDDVAKNTADITKNTADISKNTEDIEKNTNNVASILQLIDIDNAKINPDTLENSINGSVDVIVDVDNDKLEIHLSDELQDTISTHTSTIATNTADIAKNTADITKNTADISKNTEDITKNTADITNLESRTKNLEDTKVNVNTGTFDPTSDIPAGQKSIVNAIIEADLNARFSRVSTKDLSGAFGNLPSYYSGKFHLLRELSFPWGGDFNLSLLFACTKVKEIDYSQFLDDVFKYADAINMNNSFFITTVSTISATYSLRNVKSMKNAFSYSKSLKTIKLRDFPVSFDISASTLFEESDLVEIIGNLMDLTGKTAQTLTMGATNLAKLTDAEKVIATNKNWALA